VDTVRRVVLIAALKANEADAEGIEPVPLGMAPDGGAPPPGPPPMPEFSFSTPPFSVRYAAGVML
jgi:hypothetical protein